MVLGINKLLESARVFWTEGWADSRYSHHSKEFGTGRLASVGVQGCSRCRLQKAEGRLEMNDQRGKVPQDQHYGLSTCVAPSPRPGRRGRRNRSIQCREARIGWRPNMVVLPCKLKPECYRKQRTNANIIEQSPFRALSSLACRMGGLWVVFYKSGFGAGHPPREASPDSGFPDSSARPRFGWLREPETRWP
jgi:hypothetical protein